MMFRSQKLKSWHLNEILGLIEAIYFKSYHFNKIRWKTQQICMQLIPMDTLSGNRISGQVGTAVAVKTSFFPFSDSEFA